MNGFIRDAKKVVQLSNPHELPLKTYRSISEAALVIRKNNNLDKSQLTCETAICNCLRGRQHTALGYKWAYL